MTTVDDDATGRSSVHAKGAPEAVLERCDRVGGATTTPLDGRDRASVARGARALRRRRVCACSPSRGGSWPRRRSRRAASRPSGARASLGLVALFDPPRPEVAEAVARCHAPGSGSSSITGDYGPTAAEIARRVGIAGDGATIVTGDELERMSERELDLLLARGRRADLRAQLARGEAPHRRRAAQPRARSSR